MKKIINSKLYDTESSSLIAEVDNGYGVSDVHYAKYWLYKKRNGKFWLYGEGNAGSDCAEYDKAYGRWAPGTMIKPLTFEEAERWFEEYQDQIDDKVFTEEFGPIKKDPTNITRTYSIPRYVANELTRLAQESDRTPSEMLATMIKREYQQKHGNEGLKY